MSDLLTPEQRESVRKSMRFVADNWPRLQVGDGWVETFESTFKDETFEDMKHALQNVKMKSDGLEPELSHIKSELDQIKRARLPVSIYSNIAKVKSLWPNAGLKSDFFDLFRREFENSNPAWVNDAIDTVKRQKSSHVPELKWFIEAFQDRKIEESRKSRIASAPPQSYEEFLEWVRTQPIDNNEKARLKAQWLERETKAIEEANAKIRRWLADIHPDTIGRIKAAMAQRAGLRDLVPSLDKPIAEWNAFTVQTAWAVARKDGLDDTAPATFAGASHDAGDDR